MPLEIFPVLVGRHTIPESANDAVVLPSFEEVKSDKKLFAAAFKRFYLEQDSFRGCRLIQDQGAWHVVQNRPAEPCFD